MQMIQQKYGSLRPAQRRRLFLSTLAVLSGLVSVPAAFASNITVASPVNGTTTQSPTLVRAHNVGCNGLTPIGFGFSIDNSSTVTMAATPYDIDVTNLSLANGTHTIYFKAWTSNGVCPVVSTTFNVGGSTSGVSNLAGTASSVSSSSSIPSNAIASADLDASGNWSYVHDSGTPGSSRGSTAFPATTPLYDDAREFYMTYSDHGGERWHNSFATDSASTHFVLDTYVYVSNPDQLANLELDLNQVMSDGKTVIFGTQCSSYSNTWEWTYYSGGWHWHSSNISCDTKTWAAHTWHHIQIGFHRDSNGTVTHDWVNFDGTHSTFSGATSLSAKDLGWANGSLIMNVQMDGASSGSGSLTSYFHKMTFYRW